MHPRNDDIWEWRPVSIDVDTTGGTTATAASNYVWHLAPDDESYGLSKADVIRLNELVDRCWVSRKRDTPVKKEVNVDAWKEVFATSAAGS